MTFKPCGIIPIYNHVEMIEKVIKNIIGALPIFVIDDGGSVEVKVKLQDICNRYEQCTLVSLDKNMGKGFAVSVGFKEAYNRGFTHALQVDADGQHDVSSLNIFLEKSKTNPDALICGKPIYNEDIPKARLIGRKLTTNCVAIETLSKDIVDAMIGFRIYPLGTVIKLLNKTKIGSRMDFDIEIIVRLHWIGIPMLFLPVTIKYPDDGVSNFRVFKDNFSISKVHTILITTMVFTFPRVIYRNIKRERCI